MSRSITSSSKNLEGFGGPISYNKPSTADIDPTLDACCQRDLEERRLGHAIRTTLQRFDVVAERERRRRHAITLNHSKSFPNGSEPQHDTGCRCSYDPNGDGGEYKALIELRIAHNRDVSDTHSNDHNNYYDGTLDLKHEKESSYDYPIDKKGDVSSDDDDEDEYDYLLDEDLPITHDLEEIRRTELEWGILQNEISLLHGYGIHRQIHPQRVLTVAGLTTKLASNSAKSSGFPPPEAVVLHFVDADSISSASLDLYLEQLATQYRGTMFIRSSGRATILLNSSLVNDTLPMFHLTSQPDNELPALIAIKNGIAINASIRLQGILSSSSGYHDDTEVEPSAVFSWLERSGVLHDTPPDISMICRLRPEEEALMDSCLRAAPEQKVSENDRFDCGKEGCSKTFFHQHVGEQNDKQDGLIIPEEDILK